MSSTFVPVTVSVPEDCVSDVYSYVARLIAGRAGGDPSIGDAEDRKARVRNGFGPNAVRSAYVGGVSEHWKPFLETLARTPDTWVAWTELYEGLGLTNRQAAGMLGAAERRCKGHPPYEKASDHDDHWFRMPGAIADIVNELATQAR